MSIDGVGKSKADISYLKAGMEIKTVKGDAKMESIFKALDKNNNGVLEENEINSFKKDFDGNSDGVASKKEAKSFIKENGLKGQDIKKKDVIKFLQQYGENTANVKDTQVLQNGSVAITYNDGSQKVVNPDKSFDTVVTNDEGQKVTQSFDKNEVLQKDKVETKTETAETTYASDGKTPVQTKVVNTEDKTITVIDYDSNGKYQKAVVTSQNDGSVTTVNYDNGKEKTKNIKQGSTESNYEYLEDGTERITSKVENKGIPTKEAKSTFTYNQDGTVTENIETYDATTTRHMTADNKVSTEDIKYKDGRTAHRQYYENGYTEQTKDSKGNDTVNIRTLDHKNLEQHKIIDGKEFVASYDGEGNTKVVVQYGETPAVLAKKFGCTEAQLKELNKDSIGKNGNFEFGSEVKIPGELEADDAKLQSRKSAEDVKAEVEHKRAIAYAKKMQKQAETAQLKQQFGLKNRNGEGGKIKGTYQNTGRKEEFTIVGEAINGRTIAKTKDGKYVTISNDGYILKEAYVKNTTQFARGEKIQGKVKDKNGNIVTQQYSVVQKNIDKHGRSVVVDSKGNYHTMAKDGTILRADYVARSNTADAMRADSATAQKETMGMLLNQVESAEAAFNHQMADDGWAGDLADGMSAIWGSKNRAKYVRQDIAQYKADLKELQGCKSEQEFKTKFKQKFGVEYNQNAVANYMQHPTTANYQKAFGTQRDIGTRVAEYNKSQQQGAAAIKTGVKLGAAIAVGVATGGTGFVALGAVAAATAGTSFVVDASDRLNVTGSYTDASGNKVDAGHGFREGTNLKEIARDAALDGGAVFVGGVVAKGAKTIVASSKVMSAMSTTGQKLATAGISMTGDVAYGAGQEYITTGEVTASGTLVNAAMSAVGSGIELGGAAYLKNKFKGGHAEVPTGHVDAPSTPPAGALEAPSAKALDYTPGPGVPERVSTPHSSGPDPSGPHSTKTHTSEHTSGSHTSEHTSRARASEHTSGPYTSEHASGARTSEHTSGARATGAKHSTSADGTRTTQKPKSQGGTSHTDAEVKIKQAMDDIRPKLKEAEIANNLQSEFSDVLSGSITDPKVLRNRTKEMILKAHPDHGGSSDLFRAVNDLKNAKTPADVSKARAALNKLLKEKSANLSSIQSQMSALESQARAASSSTAGVAPKAETPRTETPKAESQKTEAPKSEAPKQDAPKSEGSKAKENSSAKEYQAEATATTLGALGIGAKLRRGMKSGYGSRLGNSLSSAKQQGSKLEGQAEDQFA